MPDPTPAPVETCKGLPGAAYDICAGRAGTGGGTGGGAGGTDSIDNPLDPLTSLAHSVGKAAAWLVRHLGEAIQNPHQIDLAGAGFVRTYSIVFAASSILVLVLWLKAVTKRAVNGAPMLTAMSEAIGLLWIAVACTAFSPAILYVVIEAVSAVTQVLTSALGTHSASNLFESMAVDLEAGAGGGGPLMWIVRGLATMVLCGALWLLLVLRGLALVVGEILGILVYSGMVDRDWWGKVRKWSGGILAIVAIEPIIVIVLGLASALQGGGEHGSVTTGLAITGIAVGASVALVLRVPGMGEAFRIARVQGRLAGRAAGGAIGAMTSSAGTGAAAGVMRGINTHSDRGDNKNSNSGNRSNTTSGPQGGMAAHSQRKPRPPKPKEPGAGS
ncbi:hypothetical protein [Streptomyces noursei]